MQNKRKQKRIQQITELLAPIVSLIAPLFKSSTKGNKTWGFLLSEHQGLDGNLRALFDFAYYHPGITPYLLQRFHHLPGFIGNAPTKLLVGKPGQCVQQSVYIRTD